MTFVLPNTLFSPGDFVCNVSDAHTVPEEDDVVYTCRFKYQGRRPEPILWEGPGVIEAHTFSDWTVEPVPNGTLFSKGEE